MLGLYRTLERRFEALRANPTVSEVRVTAWISIAEMLPKGLETFEVIDLVDGIFFEWGDDSLVYWKEAQ